MEGTATNQSQPFVDQVGPDDFAEAVRDLANEIDRTIEAVRASGLLTVPDLLDETESLQAELFRALEQSGELYQAILGAASTLDLAELEIERLTSEVRRLDETRNLAVATGKGHYVAKELSFIKQLVLIAIASFTASAGAVALDHFVATADHPSTPTIEEIVQRCDYLSDQWIRIIQEPQRH